MLNKTNRISNRQLISKLLAKGKVYHSNLFTVKYLPSETSASQFAITVSKKISGNAVDRNLIRRRISEGIRINLKLIKKAIVAVIIAKAGTMECDYQNIEETLIKFFNQLEPNVQ